MSFPQINDETAEIFARFSVPSQPALVIIAPDGEVQTLFGAVDDDLVDSLITDALA